MPKEKPWKTVELPSYSSPEKPGTLIVAEVAEVTDGRFDCARRIYFSTNTSNRVETRGGHSYPAGGKQIFLIVTAGTVIFELHHPEHCGRIVIDRPDQALVISHDVWIRTHLEPGAQVLTIASTNYSEGEGQPERKCSCE